MFAKDFVAVPIHCHGNHWTLALINFRERRFEYFDSLCGGPDQVLVNLRRWLQDEHLAKKGAILDLSPWEDVVWDCNNDGTPHQENGKDCGVFMTRTADYVARNAVLDFSQADMLYMRRRMVLELLSTELLSDTEALHANAHVKAMWTHLMERELAIKVEMERELQQMDDLHHAQWHECNEQLIKCYKEASAEAEEWDEPDFDMERELAFEDEIEIDFESMASAM